MSYELVIAEPDTVYSPTAVAALHGQKMRDPHDDRIVEIVRAVGEGEPHHGGHPEVRLTVEPVPVPAVLLRQVEDDTLLGSCDWGECTGEQVGWGRAEGEPEGEYVAICNNCLHDQGSRDFPLAEAYTIAQAREQLAATA